MAGFYVMDALTALNLVLKLANQQTVNSLGDGDLKATQAREALEDARREVLAEGWQSNSRLINLLLNSNGRIELPTPESGYLAISLPPRYSQRFDTETSKVYVWDLRKQDWHDEQMDNIEVVVDIPEAQLETLPESLVNYIAHVGAEIYWQTRNPKMQSPMIQQRVRRARARALNDEPERNINVTSGFRNLLATHNRVRRSSRG